MRPMVAWTLAAYLLACAVGYEPLRLPGPRTPDYALTMSDQRWALVLIWTGIALLIPGFGFHLFQGVLALSPANILGLVLLVSGLVKRNRSLPDQGDGSPPPKTGAHSEVVKPLRRLGTALVVLLAIEMVLMVSCALALIYRVNVVNEILSGQVVTRSTALTADMLVRDLATAAAGITIATVTVWLLWQYRAERNARALSPSGQFSFTPGWAIGWWFIPIASLWMPFQAVRELWKASGGAPDWPELPTWRAIGWWWASWIAGLLIAYIALSNTGQAETSEEIEEIVRSDTWLAVAFITGVATDALSIAIVRAIIRRQESAATSRAMPPAPSDPLVPPEPPPLSSEM
jgi:hypothetical protein